MPTTFVKGDLFEDDQAQAQAGAKRGFAFAADCNGKLDKGISVAFKKRWPPLEAAYQERARGGKMQLGDVFAWKDPASGSFIYALGIQQDGKKSKVSTLARALEALIARATEDGVSRITLPRIGAGKGGIDRLRVKRVLTDAGAKSGISLVVFEQFVRAKAEPAADVT